MELSRRKFVKMATLTAVAGSATLLLQKPVFAHGDEDAEVINIAMGELYFRVGDGEKNADFSLEAGERHLIKLHNEGAAMHEIHFGKNPDLEGRFYKEDLLGSEAEHGAHGFMAVILEPGESATLMFVIPENKKGEWEIGCFMPGHYEGGQHAKLIVT